MITSLHVENFRCFKTINLPDLRRINVVVGKNATGKTALLEAVRLSLGGTPNSLWILNQARTFYSGLTQPMSREQFEALWNPYFFNFDRSSSISTQCRDSEGRIATTKIYYDEQKSVTTVPQQQQTQPPALPISSIVPLAFQRIDFSGTQSTIYASVNQQGGLNFDPGSELGIVSELFPSLPWNLNPQLPAQWFSQLSLHKREKEIVNAVRDEFEPALENLVVLSLGAFPAIYASVRYLKEKVPIALVSAGIGRFITMMSAVLIRDKGVVLIDEVENGLFYKILPSVWKYLLKLATSNDTQVIVSTHSLECVRALLPAMKGNEEEFTLLRVERANGSSNITLVPGKSLEAAIDQGVEVR